MLKAAFSIRDPWDLLQKDNFGLDVATQLFSTQKLSMSLTSSTLGCITLSLLYCWARGLKRAGDGKEGCVCGSLLIRE